MNAGQEQAPASRSTVRVALQPNQDSAPCHQQPSVLTAEPLATPTKPPPIPESEPTIPTAPEPPVSRSQGRHLHHPVQRLIEVFVALNAISIPHQVHGNISLADYQQDLGNALTMSEKNL